MKKKPIYKKTVAQVGYTGTKDDCCRWMTVVHWMLTHGYRFPHVKEFDKVDLRVGRDFLTETDKYEVVVLNLLFRAGMGVTLQRMQSYMRQVGGEEQVLQVAISPAHSWGAWRRRLVATGADLVFAFGDGSCVNGTFICDLPGYTAHRGDDLWVFERNL